MKALLQKYFAGACTPEEEARVRAWLTEPGNELAELTQLMDEVWLSGGRETLPEDVSRRILEQVKSKASPAKVRRMRVLRPWMAAAAITLLIAAAGALLYRHMLHIRHERTLAAVPAWKELYNNAGITKRISFPDGTQVWLAPHSKLAYPAAALPASRAIRIEGEGYFDIGQDASRPMTVFCGSLAVRVLGTAFNVEAYTQEQDIRVTLTSGKVGIADTALMRPGQQLTYHKQAGTWQIRTAAGQYTDMWKSGYLVLNDVSLYNGLQRVARRNGLLLEYMPELLPALQHKKVTGAFRNEKAEDMIANMLFVHGYHFRKKDDHILILP